MERSNFIGGLFREMLLELASFLQSAIPAGFLGQMAGIAGPKTDHGGHGFIGLQYSGGGQMHADGFHIHQTAQVPLV